ncbi:MAG: DUF1838 family protein [Chromatiales bacterium]|nr:DUF1838 family protein [Chromatiales bacterium]
MYLDAMRSTVASFSRRGVLGLGVAAGLGGLSGLAGLASGPARAASPAVGKSGALDLTTAADNIYAFAKTWGTLGDEIVFGGHEGVFFAVVGDRRAMPLFGYVGFGSLQFRILPNGDAEYRGKDATFYTDLKTGELLDAWQNPFTGKTVKVYPYINEQVTTTIPASYPADRMVTDAYRWEIAIGNAASRKEDAHSYRGDQGESGRSVPFVLPWRRVGNHYLLTWDWMLEVANPVTPEGWPEASTGPVINPSEHFTFFVPAGELEDRGRPWATMTAGFFRQCPWLPWMRMGRSGVEGRMFANSHSYKITGGLDNIPRPVRARLERDRPDMLLPPKDWTQHPVGSSWGYYAKVAPKE